MGERRGLTLSSLLHFPHPAIVRHKDMQKERIMTHDFRPTWMWDSHSSLMKIRGVVVANESGMIGEIRETRTNATKRLPSISRIYKISKFPVVKSETNFETPSQDKSNQNFVIVKRKTQKRRQGCRLEW